MIQQISMSLQDQLKSYEKEYFYVARRTAELASQYQTSRETTLIMENKLKEVRDKIKAVEVADMIDEGSGKIATTSL